MDTNPPLSWTRCTTACALCPLPEPHPTHMHAGKSTSEGERRSCLSPTKRQLQFEGAPETLGESATSTAAAAAAAKRSRSLAKTMKTAGKGLSDHILVRHPTFPTGHCGSFVLSPSELPD